MAVAPAKRGNQTCICNQSQSQGFPADFFSVTEIREDAAFLTAHLTFHPVDFSDISDNFELNWSQYELRPSGHARARPRDVVDSVNDFTNNLMHPTGTNEPSDEGSGEGSDEPELLHPSNEATQER